jgi:TolA-binding protein
MAGMLASGAAALGLLGYILFGRRRLAPPAAGLSLARQGGSYRLPLLAVWLVMVLAGAWYATRAPEREYSRAWESMRANRYAEAAVDFLLAYERRRPQAKKEEALFWLAKASELAGRFDEAAARYRELVENYHGYWVPESLYTLVVLDKVSAGKIRAEAYAVRLRAEYPENRWARKLDNVK